MYMPVHFVWTMETLLAVAISIQYYARSAQILSHKNVHIVELAMAYN
jgi:hypothetical protein